MTFVLLLLVWAAATGWFWWSADRRARRLSLRVRRPVRLAFAAFYLPLLLYLVIPLSRPLLEHEPRFPPAAWATVAYVWFPIVLNAAIAVAVAAAAWRSVGRTLARRPPVTAAAAAPVETPSDPPTDPRPTPTRRQALGWALAVLPPVTTLGLAAAAWSQRGDFRVRRLDLAVPGLPPDLDGLTIVHVTDLHVGHFLPDDALARLADTVNELRADLVAFTGDLVDRGLLDRVPLGIDFVDRLDRRNGLALIEGNHDVLEDAAKFERAARDAKLPLLLDEQATFAVRGRRTAVQFLGISWGTLKSHAEVRTIGGDPDRMLRVYSEEATTRNVQRVSALRRPDAFPILLAHHPHAAEPAAVAGLPLVLAGHSHGGQVMLTDHVGAGPLRFRYWTGVHRLGPTTLSICNGIGSWFPLRVNAPALKSVLRTAKSLVPGRSSRGRDDVTGQFGLWCRLSSLHV